MNNKLVAKWDKLKCIISFTPLKKESIKIHYNEIKFTKNRFCTHV